MIFVFDVKQVLSKQDAEALALCKNMMDRGECPPLMVVFDPYEGYFNLLISFSLEICIFNNVE